MRNQSPISFIPNSIAIPQMEYLSSSRFPFTILLIIVLGMMSFKHAHAQCVNNPSVQAGNINPAPLNLGDTGTLSFTYIEYLLDYTDDENNPVEVSICLLNIQPINGISSVGGAFASTFTWTYDPTTNCLLGTQNQDILGGSGGEISVNFNVSNIVNCPSNQLGFNVNILPPACMALSNETTDDTESTYTCIVDCGPYSSTPHSLIPDNSYLIDVITIANTNFSITDLNVVVEIHHTWLEDLDITLIGPSGDSVYLMMDQCSSDDNMYIEFDDDGTPVVCATPTIGLFKPQVGALSVFNGMPLNGNWKLLVVDDQVVDTGGLTKWCLKPTTCDLSATVSSPNPSCNGTTNQQIIATVTGGMPPYSYSWSNGQTTPTISNLTLGDYSVTITDAAGCYTIRQTTIPMVLSGNTTDVSCNGTNDGSIDITVTTIGTPTNGCPAYYYLWSNGSTTEDLSALSSGIYCVTVTEACAGYVIIESFTITDSTSSFNNPSVQAGTIDPAPLSLGDTGTLSFTYFENLLDYTDEENNPIKVSICLLNIQPINGISSVGGAFSPTFTWTYDPITNCLLGTQNQDIQGGTGGVISMNFNVTNIVNCPSNQLGFNVDIQIPPCMTSNSPTDDTESVYTCVESCGPYSSAPDAPIPDNSYITDKITITGSNSLITDLNVVVDITHTWLDDLELRLIGPNGDSVILMSAQCGGASDLYIGFDDEGGMLSCSTPTIGVFTPQIGALSIFDGIPLNGDWTLVVSDNQGTDFGILNKWCLEPTDCGLSTMLSNTDVSCYGGSDGSITAIVTSGMPPYSYNWNDGQTTSTISNLVPGIYSVTITDAAGCSGIEQTMLITPDPLVVTGVTTNASCQGANDGSIDITVTGGTISGNGCTNFFLWSNGSTTEDLSNLSPGSYTVTVTNCNGCTATESFTISGPQSTGFIDGCATVCTGYQPTYTELYAANFPTGASNFQWTLQQQNSSSAFIASGQGTSMVEIGFPNLNPLDTFITLLVSADVSCGTETVSLTIFLDKNCVWPGDVNNDNQVILNFGINWVDDAIAYNFAYNNLLSYQNIGTTHKYPRPAQCLAQEPWEWLPQSARNWKWETFNVPPISAIFYLRDGSGNILDTFNLKYADCNGDGDLIPGSNWRPLNQPFDSVVNKTDQDVITYHAYNYQTHNGNASNINNNQDTLFRIETPNTVYDDSSEIVFIIYIGSPDNPIEDVSNVAIIQEASFGVHRQPQVHLDSSHLTTDTTRLADHPFNLETTSMGPSDSMKYYMALSSIDGSSIDFEGEEFCRVVCVVTPAQFQTTLSNTNSMSPTDSIPVTFKISAGGIGHEGGSITHGISNEVTVWIRPTPVLNAKIVLGGAYDLSTGLMFDDLRVDQLIPDTDPYLGTHTVDSSVLSVSGPEAIVDWVLIEIRDQLDKSIVSKRPALVTRSGKIVEVDGVSSARLSVAIGSYYVVIRHRNHLAVMTGTPIDFSQSPGSNHIDFTNPNTATFGTDAMAALDGIMVMWAGDADHNGVVSAPDRSLMWNGRNSSGYNGVDANLDGVCNAFDRSICWNNRNRIEQVPK